LLLLLKAQSNGKITDMDARVALVGCDYRSHFAVFFPKKALLWQAFSS
jgi:hypothetical protein